jgi:hypothetical protein
MSVPERAAAGSGAKKGRLASLVDSIPPENPTDPHDIALKKEAEAFRNQVEDDLDAYDLAHVEALEAKITRVGSWLFPRSASSESAAPLSETAAAAAAVATATLKKETIASSSQFSRVRADDTTPLGDAKQPAAAYLRHRQQQSLARRLMYRRHNPNRLPLLERWYVPYVCVGLAILTWTPDTWKLRTLYIADAYYAKFRRAVHTAYWKYTMDPEEFVLLMEQMEANLPRHLRTVKGSNCPM